jgi:two-component system, cell cycle sensor histidine kinase and response regulator CckA
MLQELGFTVVTANDGREALERFQAAPGFAFVVLDLTMPVMDGEQCFQELKSCRHDVKVVMSSGYNEQEGTEQFAGQGLAGVIQKPYHLSTLRETIRGILPKAVRVSGNRARPLYQNELSLARNANLERHDSRQSPV